MGIIWAPMAASTWGFSKMPAATMDLAPASTSSPGWNMNLTVPFSSFSRSFSIWAAPSSMAVCISWPQVWAQLRWEAKGRPLFSSMGRASISARSRNTFPCGFPVTVAVTPPPSRWG